MVQNNSTTRDYLIIALLILILLLIVFYLINSRHRKYDYRKDYNYNYNARNSSSLRKKFVNERSPSSSNEDSSYFKY